MRKIIQISESTAILSKERGEWLITMGALCDDGSTWIYHTESDGWYKCPDVPQSKDEELDEPPLNKSPWTLETRFKPRFIDLDKGEKITDLNRCMIYYKHLDSDEETIYRLGFGWYLQRNGKKFWGLDIGCGYVIVNVSHWQKLPLPPICYNE